MLKRLSQFKIPLIAVSLGLPPMAFALPLPPFSELPPGTRAHPPLAVSSGIPEFPNACMTLGSQRIAVILATYPGAPADSAAPNPSYISELFVGTDQGFSVANYYKKVSNLKTYFHTVKILGPYTAPSAFVIDRSVDPNNLYTGLDQWEASLLTLASKDTDLMQIDRVVFITPEAIDPTGAAVAMGAGLSTQGVCDLDYAGPEGHRTFAHSWVRAAVNYKGVDPTKISTDAGSLPPGELQALEKTQMMLDAAPLIHELGHTFNLGHANQIKRPETAFSPPFNDEVLPAADQNLYEIEYGDPFSVMSSNELGWFNLAHLSQLGWLNPNEIQEVRANGTFRIYPLETPGKLRGIKIPRALKDPNEQTSAYLWVEYRQNLTIYDTDLSGLNHSMDGALVHYTNPNQPMPDNYYPFETLLLNFVPAGTTVSPFQKDLTLKTSWQDPHSMVDLKIIQVTPQYLDVQVEFTQ